MKHLIFLSAVAALPAFAATSIVGELRYDKTERIVYVDYTLTKPSIVTFDLQTNVVTAAGVTNWVSIGVENYKSVEGNLNRLIDEVGVLQTIRWVPFEDWPVKRVKAGTIRAVVTAWSVENPPDYCVININRNDTVTPATLKDRVRYYTCEEALPGGLKENATYWTTNMVMRRVHAAGKTFRMGSPWTECQGESNYTYRSPEEEPTVVTFSKDYWMAIFPMTCKQASLAFGHPGNHSNGDKGPMTGRKWSEFRIDSANDGKISTLTETDYDWPANGCSHAVGSNSWFGKMKANTGLEFDFPTEAQWEFACRAGTTTPYCGGEKDPFDTSHLEKYNAQLDPYGWYKGNCDAVQPVMGKKPNAWGFYDMHGNVLEYCLDHYPVADGGYNRRPIGITATDYPGPLTGPQAASYQDVIGYKRIVKGGKYSSNGYECRSARRAVVGECAFGNPGENAARPVAALTFKW